MYMWLLTRIKSVTLLVIHASGSKSTVGLEEHFLIINKISLFACLGDFSFEVEEVEEISKVTCPTYLFYCGWSRKGSPVLEVTRLVPELYQN